jgi:hypothetical protein
MQILKRPRLVVAQIWSLESGDACFGSVHFGDLRANDLRANTCVRTMRASNIESGEGGPCLTDAAHVAALDEPFVSGWPLRCGPNAYRSDHCGTKPRWRHAILRATSACTVP